MGKSEEGEMVCFDDFVRDDVVAVIICVFELHYVTPGHVGNRGGYNSVLSKRSVDCRLRGDDETVSRLQWVHLEADCIC